MADKGVWGTKSALCNSKFKFDLMSYNKTVNDFVDFENK
jgi:hypothetical protein